MPSRLVLTPLQKRALNQGKTVMVKRRGRPRRYKKRARTNVRYGRVLKTGYRGPPNVYSFVRETRPVTIDIGDNTTPGVTIIAGTGTIPDTSVFEFPNFSIDQLAGGFTEFSELFANYKVKRIEAVMIPMWTSNAQPTINPLTGAWTSTSTISNLMATRINTKYLINGYTLPGTAEANRDQLAQVNKKTRSLYGTRKWLKIITSRPRVKAQIEDGAGGQNEYSKPSPWLSTVDSPDQEYDMNDIVFFDKLNGTDFERGIYLYRMYLRVHFECSFVG